MTPTKARYHARRTAGMCTQCGTRKARADAFTCERCSERKRRWYASRERVRREARTLAPSAPQVACCGQWWTIAGLSLRVACCNRVYFAEAWKGEA